MPPTTNDRPPTTKGWVTTSYRNYKGKRLGPYHYRRWKVGSKIHRQYIKPADVERVKAECAAYSEQRRSKREAGRRVNIYLDNFIFQSKMYFRYEKGKTVRPDQEAYIVRLHNEGMYIIGRPLYRPRKLFGDPFLSNFVSECLFRRIDPLEAQLLSALGANIDQIERIVKSDPDSQEHKEEMQNLFAAFQKEIVASQNFGDPSFSKNLPTDEPSNPATKNRATECFGDPKFSNSAPCPSGPEAPSSALRVPSFGDPTLSKRVCSTRPPRSSVHSAPPLSSLPKARCHALQTPLHLIQHQESSILNLAPADISTRRLISNNPSDEYGPAGCRRYEADPWANGS